MTLRLISVTWLDASDPDEDGKSWRSEDEVEAFAHEACEVTSVGWEKTRTRQYLTLVADYIVGKDGSMTWGRVTKVPLGMIQSETELHPASGCAVDVVRPDVAAVKDK